MDVLSSMTKAISDDEAIIPLEGVGAAKRMKACYACGALVHLPGADRTFHHRQKHLQSYLKWFEQPEDTDTSNKVSDAILRAINAAGERFTDLGWRVENLEKVRKDFGEDYIKTDVTRDRVVYFSSRPPFFLTRRSQLEDVLTTKPKPSLEWPEEALFRSRVVHNFPTSIKAAERARSFVDMVDADAERKSEKFGENQVKMIHTPEESKKEK